MRLYVCRINSVTVRTGWYGVSLGPGSVVDLDAPANPHDPGSPTMREALGDLVSGFDPIDPDTDHTDHAGPGAGTPPVPGPVDKE